MNIVVPWLLPVIAGVITLALHAAFWFGGVYAVAPVVDVPMHFGGGVIVALGVLAAVPLLRCGSTRVELSILIFASATTVGVLWEFFEYALDEALGTAFQTSIGDTLKDIFLAMLGSIIVIIWNWRRSSKVLEATKQRSP
jgi:hypothetical protein